MQMLIHLPDDLVGRLRSAVPPRRRSAFIAELLRNALPQPGDDPLYHLALEVEKDQTLNAQMQEWDALVSDGLNLDDNATR